MGKIWEKCQKIYARMRLRSVIWMAFSIAAISCAVLIGSSFYQRFTSQLEYVASVQSQALLEQVSYTLTATLRNMMKISDTLSYSVLKENDLARTDMEEKFRLIYDSNKNYIQNIVLFRKDGEMLAKAPAATLREGVHAAEEEWFQNAVEQPENMHFSLPHVQKLFVHRDHSYNRVISISQAVQIKENGQLEEGVLLIDLSYDAIARMITSISPGSASYVYLTDRSGEIIYHPSHQMILNGKVKEDNLEAAGYSDGVYNGKFQGERRMTAVKTIGYTGWKLVSVTEGWYTTLISPKSVLSLVAVALLFIIGLGMINGFISDRVTDPISRLEIALKEIEGGNFDTVIREKGCYELRHLSRSVKQMAVKLHRLMEQAEREHEIQRKNELNTLQSQINPHFLYNTLDIVIWMVQNEKKEDAVQALTALARFFRIGLSGGRTIISVGEELEHVKSYLTIQMMRHKNKFQYHFEIQEEVENLATLKLILQPLVENAIAYGVQYQDGDGEIWIRAYQEGGSLILQVEDNGLGIPPDRLEDLRRGKISPSGKGSGIGVRNVNERIALYFGEDYGLAIDTELDEGTVVTLTQPAVEYERMINEEA